MDLIRNRVDRNRRIVVTGGPAAGKTTVLEILKRDWVHCCAVVPESATILYSGGFIRSPEDEVVMAAQRAIFEIQKSLENSFAHLNPNKHLVCDRGSADGAVYWPLGERKFFDAFKTSIEEEFELYDAVIFFETSAVCDFSGKEGNPVRNESREEALRLDGKLRKLYENHPQFYFVPHEKSFQRKIESSFQVFEQLLLGAENSTRKGNQPFASVPIGIQ